MKSLAEIRKQLYSQEFQLTRHALKRQTERNISFLCMSQIRMIGLILRSGETN